MGLYCSIGPSVLSGYGEHPTHLLSTSPLFYLPSNPFDVSLATSNPFSLGDKSVEVGSDVWIGAKSVLRNGISVGPGAVIGAGAVVTKDVAPYCIVGGVPARVIRTRFDDVIIERLLKLRWWEYDFEKLRSLQLNFVEFDTRTLDAIEESLSAVPRMAVVK